MPSPKLLETADVSVSDNNVTHQITNEESTTISHLFGEMKKI